MTSWPPMKWSIELVRPGRAEVVTKRAAKAWGRRAKKKKLFTITVCADLGCLCQNTGDTEAQNCQRGCEACLFGKRAFWTDEELIHNAILCAAACASESFLDRLFDFVDIGGAFAECLEVSIEWH